MIDFHAHFGNFTRVDDPAKPTLGAERLVEIMDREGIDQAVLLPLESPDWGGGYCLTEEVLAARDRDPERFVAFVCADPRYPHALKFIEDCVAHRGCLGFGEHVCGLALDDPLNLRLYGKCDELALPLVFEIARPAICNDTPGLPRLERCLREFGHVKWCGHGPHFWTAISGDDGKFPVPYPGGRVTPGGAIDRLMAEYDNLYLDLSGQSGYNAMTRDPEFTLGFIERHWRKMLFGTDICYANETPPIIKWMRTVPISEVQREAIADGNARRLLGLGRRRGRHD